MNPTLVEPEFHFFVATLILGRFLENNDVDFAIVV